MPSGTRIAGDRPALVQVRITPRSAMLVVSVVVGFLVLREAFVSAHRVLAWAAASAATAAAVHPVADRLGRYIPRAAAVLLTFLVVTAAILALVFGSVDNLDREVDRLRREAPAATEALEARQDELGRAMRDIDLSARVDAFLTTLDSRIGSGGGAIVQNAPVLPVYVVNAVLTVFLLVYGPRMVEGALGRIGDPEVRAVVRAAAVEAVHRTRRSLGALVGQGVVVGAMAWLGATLLDLPAPIALGVIAGVGALVPDLGIVVGVVPMVALVGGLHGVRLAVGVVVLAILVQVAEAVWLRSRVDRWGVRLGPLVVWIVALVGFTVYGVGAAVFGVVYAAFVLALVDQVPSVRHQLAARAGPT